MRSLPLPARLFWLTVVGAGIAVLPYLNLGPTPRAGTRWLDIAVLALLAALLSSRKILLYRRTSTEDEGSMSVGTTITFVALLSHGPAAALLVATAGCLSSCLYPRRQPAYQLAFNLALTILETWSASQAFLAINSGDLTLRMPDTALALMAAALAYFLVSTGGVATIIGLVAGESGVQIWRRQFLLTAPSYLASAGISALAVVAFGDRLAPVLVLVTPVALLGFQSVRDQVKGVEKQRHIEQLAELYEATIKSLALAIDAKDQYTHQRILRIQHYSMATAEKLGLTGDELKGLRTGALLHDIGMLGVPDHILMKTARLSDEEYATVRRHPEIGAAILSPVEFPWPVLPVVRHHHERWDGSGYPAGLRGEEIPRTARILAVADAYDALTSNRSYRSAWTHERAVAEIRRGAGTHFDPQIVDAFSSVIDEAVRQLRVRGALQGDPGADTVRSDAAVRDIQRASSELWALYEVAQTLSASMGLQETLDILARKLEAILPGTACLFLLREPDSDRLRVRAAVGTGGAPFRGATTGGQQSRSWQVAQSLMTFQGAFDSSDLIPDSDADPIDPAFRSALIVPIVHQTETLGTINVYRCEDEAFGLYERQLLERIAERTSRALYSSLLYDRTRSHAITDPTTGLFNVRYLTDHVEGQCLRAQSRPDARFALLCLDLDSFKPINDNFGHQRGDRVLQELASLMRSHARTEDVVARYGGDEFLIALEDTGPIEAAAMARRLQDAIAHYDPALEHPQLGALRLGVSVGCACYPDDGLDTTSLITVADFRMYEDKTERKLRNLADDSRRRAA